MALKTTIGNLEDVPEPLREHYSPTADGTFALSLDGEPAGYVPKAKFKEFRANNKALHKANEELEARLKAFDGLDPVAARAAIAELADTEIVDDSELQAELAAERAAHAETKFKSIVSTEFLRAGGRLSAVDFMVANAAKVFSLKDGQIATDEFSAVNPGEPLTVAEWVGAQQQTADFAFQPSRGGGAPPNAGPGNRARRVIGSDPLEFGQNIEAIANGSVTVGD